MNKQISAWPQLNYGEAKETYKTLHLFTQVIGKIKLVTLPWINHSWHVTLFVTPYGLTTSDMPHGGLHFQIDFDFCEHKLKLANNHKKLCEFSLKGLSVADFYGKVMSALKELGIEIKINRKPSEMAEAILFDEDNVHKTYNERHVSALHVAMLKTKDVLSTFRAEFRGKCSPVHLFWGALDLAVTRFSGRKAPKHPGGVPNLPDRVAQEAYSNEVSSCGFWPGNDMAPFAAFYSYAYPEPDGYSKAEVLPKEAYYDKNMREFLLPYDAVRNASDPEQVLLDFLHTTYNAAADLAKWDRQNLESISFA